MKAKNIKVILVIIVYLLIGLFLMLEGKKSSDLCPANNETVSLPRDIPIAQRIQGNDFCIENMLLYISESSVSEDAVLSVYLMEGGFDLQKDIIKEEITYSGSDINGKKELLIAFSQKTKLVFDRDYYIVFLYTDPVEKGTIVLEANSDFSGIYSDGVDYGISFAYNIRYFTHQSSFLFIWKLTFIMGSVITAVCIAKKISFFEAAGIVCISIVLLMYMFGIAGVLKWGYYFILFLALGSFAFVVWFLLKNPWNEIEQTGKKYFISGCITTIILSVLYCMIDQGRIIEYWDEMSHWATAAKNMYIYDSFPMHEKSTVMLLRYPPIYTVLQYFFMQIGGKYSVDIMHFAKHFFQMSLIFGCFTGEKEQNQTGTVIASVILCLGIPELFFSEWIAGSLYNDIIVGVSFGYVLIRFKRLSEAFSVYSLYIFIAGIITCILSKDTGLIFILVMIAGIFGTLCYQYWTKRTWNKQFLKYGMVIAGAIAIGEGSWHAYLKLNAYRVMTKVGDDIVVQAGRQIDTIAASGIKKNRIIEFLMGRGEAYQYEIIPRHIKKLLFGTDFPNNIVTLSFFGWVIILAIVIYLLARYTKSQEDNEIWIVFVLITSIGIAVVYHILYTFTFPREIALTFGSEDRYLAAFLIAIAMLIFYMGKSMFQCLPKDISVRAMTCITIVILLLTDFCADYRFWSTTGHAWNRNVTEEMYNKAVNLRKAVREDETVFCISKQDERLYYFCYLYHLTPVKINSGPFYPVIQSPAAYEVQTTPEEWKTVLQNYDYLYIDHCDSEFIKNYGCLFENTTEIEDGGLYTINQNDGFILRKYKTVN